MKTLVVVSLVVSVLFAGAFSTSAAVLFSDDFSSLVKTPGGSYYWAPQWAYPNTTEVVTEDGRSALHMAYNTGVNKGITLVGTPIPTGDNLNISVTFKPVGEASLPFYVRMVSYDYDLGDFAIYLDTFFWGANPNGNLVDLQDWHNGNAYWGPNGDNKVFHSGSEATNWYTYTINVGATDSVASLFDVNGNLLWKSAPIVGVGTSNMKAVNHFEFSLFAEYNANYGSGVDNYIDKIVMTDDPVPEPASLAALAMGLVGMAGSIIKRKHSA